MCDTVVVTAQATARRSTLFAKNSDREPGEAQALEIHEAAEHSPLAETRATYLSLPAARRTHAVLLSRPHWMWGAEMGVNEHGLAIGNEAVFTRAPRQALGLLGMDLVRLALERATSASDAVTLIGELLEEHGQGGPAGHRDKSFVYDSSFLIADPEDAWVMETANRCWVAARVSGVRAISNGLTLRDDWERASSGLAARARDFGLDVAPGRLDFARTFSDPVITRAAAAARRRACTEAWLTAREGNVSVLDAMAALRQHAGRAGSGLFTSVCAHASWPPTRRAGQTTASLVSSLEPAGAVHFVTGTAAPCTSIFKPVWLDAGLADIGPTPRDRSDARSLWWRHERVHRRALADLDGFSARFASERDRLERELVDEAFAHAGRAASERRLVSDRAFSAAEDLERSWLDRTTPGKLRGRLHRRFWRAIDRRAGLVS